MKQLAPTDWLRQLGGPVTDIISRSVELPGPFTEVAARFADRAGTVALLSGGDLDCARHHILGIDPWLCLRCRGHSATVDVEGQSIQLEADPLETLQAIIRRLQTRRPSEAPPVAAGLLGYLSYDLKDVLETLPRTSVDDLHLPHICLYAHRLLIVHDKRQMTTRIFRPVRRGEDAGDAAEDIDRCLQALSAPPPGRRPFSGGATGFRSPFTRSEYMAAVDRIREYIAAGDVYQVNMSQRFEMDFSGNGYDLFQTLYERNPAPFFAYIDAGDHRIVSTSPERFILLDGTRVETRPIKGTRPRGRTPEEDSALRQDLAGSRKDDAELSMIVDLLRNDIGKVCRGGSVRVSRHKRLEAYQNVYHLVSMVEGDLDEGFDAVDLIRATFPGGSITGCPKIRSMEIIDELEPVRRHIYTGAIGYISFHQTMDLSIAIRTATLVDNRIIFSVGGGIVYDSDPADEYDETLHKGKTLMDVFKGAPRPTRATDTVWFNGKLVPAEAAVIPVTDQGVLYGHGFFETIRVDSGLIRCYPDHRDRFNRAWQALFDTTPPDMDWDTIIRQVVAANGLADVTAAVKILATRGSRHAPPFDHALVVTARAYTHRLAETGSGGLALCTYPHPRHTPLADHKTLNYLYYLRAGQWARQQGGDEALVLNADGTVSETHTANILFRIGRDVIRPASDHVLGGVMEQAAVRILKDAGYTVARQRTSPEDLTAADEVMVTNSLMGAVPVLTLDGKPLGSPTDLCTLINQTGFGPDADA